MTQARKIVVRDLKELADLFFPKQRKIVEQIGMFDDDKRRVERDEEASAGTHGTA